MKATIAVSEDGWVANARGYFTRGDQVDWPQSDIQPLIDSDRAVQGWVELEPEVEATPAARELADEHDLDLTEVEAEAGESDQIIKADVERALVDRAGASEEEEA